ncbi:hypothetical protein ACS0TY_017891 [Phlomoides rotata]
MSEGRTSNEDSSIVAFSKGRKKDSKGVVCWKCGKPRHTRRNCEGGAGAANSSKTNIVMEESDVL